MACNNMSVQQLRFRALASHLPTQNQLVPSRLSWHLSNGGPSSTFYGSNIIAALFEWYEYESRYDAASEEMLPGKDYLRYQQRRSLRIIFVHRCCWTPSSP